MVPFARAEKIPVFPFVEIGKPRHSMGMCLDGLNHSYWRILELVIMVVVGYIGAGNKPVRKQSHMQGNFDWQRVRGGNDAEKVKFISINVCFNKVPLS